MANKYTDEQKAEALAALVSNADNLKATARETGIPVPTLRTWRLKTEAGFNPENGPDYAALWGKVQAKSIERALVKADAPETSYRDLMVGAGIAADKHLNYRDGRQGAANLTVNNNTLIIEHVDDWRG